MDNTKYIEKIKSYITSLKEDIESNDEYLKKVASLQLPPTKKWLELLNSNEIKESELEHIIEQVFNIQSDDNTDLWWWSKLPHNIGSWALEAGMRMEKLKIWQEKRVKCHIRYFENWPYTDSRDKIIQAAYRISKRWLELTNSSSVTQNDIDSIMNELLSNDDFWGSGWSGMTYDFREWAEGYGFSVPSYEQVVDHYDSILQNAMSESIRQDWKVLEQHKVILDTLDWKYQQLGLRYKKYKSDNKLIWLVEIDQSFMGQKGWIMRRLGYVIEGEIEIDYDGEIDSYKPGNLISFPPNEANKNILKVISDKAILFYVEDI